MASRFSWSVPNMVLWTVACQRLPSVDGAPSDDSTPLFTTGDLAGEEGDERGVQADDGEPACDPVDQDDCEAGQKCTALQAPGGVRYGCVSDSADLPVFERCQVSGMSGADGCVAGSVCLSDGAAEGLCLPLCRGPRDCEQGTCWTDILTQIPFCALDCSPEEDVCPLPMQCRRGEDRFACAFATPEDAGGQGAPCEATADRGCSGGFVCLPGPLVPLCDGAQCCTVTCDTRSPSCPELAVCEPLFGDPAPGAEAIGACLVPS